MRTSRSRKRVNLSINSCPSCSPSSIAAAAASARSAMPPRAVDAARPDSNEPTITAAQKFGSTQGKERSLCISQPGAGEQPASDGGGSRQDGPRGEQRAVGDAHGHCRRAQTAQDPGLQRDRDRPGPGLCWCASPLIDSGHCAAVRRRGRGAGRRGGWRGRSGSASYSVREGLGPAGCVLRPGGRS
eukprot:COSAG04_NODE_1559_length_6350_cov_13.193827_4_plen_186_part_00